MMLAVLANLVSVVDGFAQDRIALVVGNADYRHERLLRTPRGDANAMAKALSDLGFDVTTAFDLDEGAFADALYLYSERAKQAEVSVFYYSGHGMEIGGTNYLIPVDARLRHGLDAKIQGIALDDVTLSVSGASQLSLVILDACRNNVFGDGKGDEFAGMAPARPLPGQVIAYSTAPNAIAYEGDTDLSPYTQALIERLLANPDEDVRIMLSSLTEKTQKYAGRPQVPYVEIGAFPEGPLSLAPAPIEVADSSAAIARPPTLDTIKDCEICPEMIVLPGGTFTRGADATVGERPKREGPQRDITVASFALARTETTLAQYARFMNESADRKPGCWIGRQSEWTFDEDVDWARPLSGGGADTPVACVSVKDAEAFIDWLNEQAGHTLYRLPSEAEWEYAARAGTETGFAAGEGLGKDSVRYFPDASLPFEPGEYGPVAVSELDAENPWGFRHILGNVYEWTADCYLETLDGARKDGVPASEGDGGDCSKRALRGGSFLDTKFGLAVTFRYGEQVNDRLFMTGFRVARDLE